MRQLFTALGMAIFLLVCLNPLQGQDEEEKVPSWQGNISLGLSLNRGNSDTTDISFDFSADHHFSEKIDWRNSGLALFGRTDQVTTKETYQLSTAINWNHTERFLSYYRIQGIRDRFKNYGYRFLPGLGVGYRFLAREGLKFTLSSGVSLVATEFYDTGDRDSYAALALSDEFIWDISENAQFNQKWELNFNFEDFGHVVWHFETSLITNIVDSWAVKLTFVNSHDGKPVGDGIEIDDYSFIAGISRKF